ASVPDVNLVNRGATDSYRPARIRDVELQVRERDHVRRGRFRIREIPSCSCSRDLQLVSAGVLQDALELHVMVVARAQCADVPHTFASFGVKNLTFTRAGEFSTIRQRGFDGDVFSRSSARVANS